jgi:hypothetical protein
MRGIVTRKLTLFSQASDITPSFHTQKIVTLDHFMLRQINLVEDHSVKGKLQSVETLRSR